MGRMITAERIAPVIEDAPAWALIGLAASGESLRGRPARSRAACLQRSVSADDRRSDTDIAALVIYGQRAFQDAGRLSEA